jgi:hypothetical protein
VVANRAVPVPPERSQRISAGGERPAAGKSGQRNEPRNATTLRDVQFVGDARHAGSAGFDAGYGGDLVPLFFSPSVRLRKPVHGRQFVRPTAFRLWAWLHHETLGSILDPQV